MDSQAQTNTAPEITAPGDKTYEQGETITAFDITVSDADGDTVTVQLSGVPSGLSYAAGQVSGTVAADATAQDHTVTISADDGVNTAVTETFTITVTEAASSNAEPEITAPGDKTYEQGETITAFDITVSDADGDTVTVELSGLPSGLAYAAGQVSGTVAADATAQDHTTISADDGVNTAVTETFTITVTEAASSNAEPVITAPGDKTYEQGEAITAFDITVSDADGDTVTVELSGLPSGLAYAAGQVSGTVAADATAQDHTVTISADDGVNTAVTETFTITVTEAASSNAEPVITAPGDKTYAQGEAITAFDISVSDADGDTVTVELSGLPSGLAYAAGQVSGTVAADATAQDHTVTISADDGVNTAVTETFTITVTREQDRPRVTLSGPSDAQNGAFDVTIAFSESVTGFEQGDVTVGNGAVTAFSGSGASYTVEVTPSATGTMTVDVAADVAVDAENDGNMAASRYSVAADLDAPTVTLSGPSDAQNGAFDVTIAFSESVTGFEQGDVTVGNGAVTAFTGSGTSYTATLTPSATGTVTVDVAADAAVDGAGNGNTAASRYSVAADLDAPTVDISGPSDAQNGAFDVTITFSESVTGFEKADVAVGADVVTGLSGSGASYTATITPTATGTVTVDVPANAAVDGAGNGNTAAGRYSVQAEAAPNAAPAITAPGAKTYEQGEAVTAFDITVTDADGDDVTVTLTGLPSGLSYTSGQVQGTVADDAAAQSYTVTIEADDGVNTAVTETFSITVTEPASSNAAPAITAPDDKSYEQGETITAFGITVTDADGDDVTVTLTGLPSGLSYTSGQVQGTVAADATAQAYTVTIEADDGVNTAVTETFSIMVTREQDRPRVTLSGPSDAQNGAFDVTIAFSESVTGFEQGDVTVGNGAVTAFSGSGTSYTATITPSATGTVTVDVAANVAADAENDGNMAASRYSVAADLDAPTVTISGPTDAQEGVFDVTIAFSESVTGFEKADVAVGTGTVTGFSGSGASYTATITPTASGTVTVDVPANAAVDGAGNGNTAASRYSVAADLDAPTVTISGPTTVQTGAFDVTITFSESVTGFEKADVAVGAGVVTGLSGSGASYTATITPTATGTVTVDVPANAAVDGAGNGNTAAGRYSVQAEAAPNAAPVIAAPDDKTYEQGEAVTAFGITVADADGDDVTVALTGLPSGLSYTSGHVQGTVAADATAQSYTVTIEATDGVNTAVTATFTVTVTEPASATGTSANAAPVITAPDDKTYERGETITAFDITVTDADDDDVTVTLTGLPSGLSYTNGQVQGTVADDAVPGDHTVTIQADDGGDAVPIETFTITVRAARAMQQTRPTVTISGPTASQSDSFDVTITFSQSVTGFDKADVTVGNGKATALSGSGASYTVTITPTASATVTVDVAANVAVDGDDNGNTAASQFTVTAALTRPTVVISGPTTVQTGAFTVDIDFSESVTGFEQADVTVGHGRVTGWAETGGSALVIITPASSGTVTVDVAANVAVDSDDNGNTAAVQYSVEADMGEPTVTITCPTGVQTGAFTVDIDFSESVTGFEQADVTVGNGRVTGWAETGGSALVIITPAGSGTVTIDVPANVAVDNDGYGNLAAQQCSVQVQLVKQVTIADASASEGHPITFTVTLGEAVPGGLTVTPSFSNGGLTTQGWATQGKDYTANTAPLRFAGTAGEKKTFTVATTQDSDIEANERFTVSLTVSGTSETVKATDTATGTIINDDACAMCWWDIRVGGDANQYTAQTLGVEEGGTVALTLTQRVDGRRTLTYWTVQPTDHNGSADPATGFVDYQHFFNFGPLKYTLEFSGKGDIKTIRIPTYEDTLVERDEYFRLNLTSNYENTGYADNRLIYIRNDDQATITVSDAQVGEGSNLYFTATLDKALAHSATVTPSVTHGTAAGDDYTANTEQITFAGTAGEKKYFSIWTKEDSVPEETETLTVGLTVARSLPWWWYTGEGDAIAVVAGTGTIEDDDTRTLTVADASANEGGSLTFTVTLDKAVPGGLTVTPSFTDVTATKGTDYTANTAALDFAGTAGETKTFTVATTDDADEEPDETFTVGLTVSGTTETVTATDTATGTILDDERLPAVTIDDSNSGEDGAMTFTVTLDKAVSGGLTVTPSFTDVTATEGADYAANTAPLNFAGTRGETQTFRVPTIGDTEAEPEETFTVSLTVSGTTETVTATDTATGTILDDDTGVIVPAVTVADASATEGGVLTFTVTLYAGVPGGLTVTPSFSGGTATKGTDYTENTTALTFDGTTGEQRTFTVATTEDSVDEANETFTVGLTVSGTTETVTATDTATGTIFDDDGARAVTVFDAAASEGDALTFTVALNKAVSGGFQVTPSFSDVTATEGTDYTANTAALTFTGNAGEQHTFTVATTDDTDAESNETFTVGLTVSGTSAAVTATDTATGTILDDDGATAVTVFEAAASEGDALTFTVALNKAVSGGFQVTPSFVDGTATKGTDYTANTAALSFAGTAGETQTFTVTTTEDEVVEVDETFTVGLTVSGTSTTVTATDTATGTITDDDTATVTVADVSNAEGGPGYSFVIDGVLFTEVSATATLDKAVQGGFQLYLYASAGTATKDPDGTSYSTTDFGANPVSLWFNGNAGERQSLDKNWVAIYQDEVVEGTETFNISYSLGPLPGAGPVLPPVPAGVTVDGPATGTIIDDDIATVTIADASATEGEAIALTATVDKAVAGGFTVTPSFTDRTATEGTDYTENTAAITFAGNAGETQTFTVATTEDADNESNETFAVSLSLSGTTLEVSATDTAVGTIIDEDGDTTLTITDASADEGGSLTFTVTLNQTVSGGLTVTPSFTDGTATGSTDYTENTAAITFAGNAGETQTLTVTTSEDEVVELDETFTVSLTVSGTSATVTATDTAIGTIVNDDSATVTLADASAGEGDSMSFTVTLDNAVSGGLTVTPSFTDVTATSGTDYTENTSAISLTGTAGEIKTFTVATTEDTNDELDETFTVGLTVSGTATAVTAPHTATGTITDDDDDGVPTVTIADASASEGNIITFTVGLDEAVSGGLKVTPSFTDGTATEGTDYTANTTAVTFAGTAGETQIFAVETPADQVVEPDETFSVSLTVSGTSVEVTATDTATGTITNDDRATLTISDDSAYEGDDLTFTITLDKAVHGGLTVTPSFTDGTATEGTDYTENTAALTFAGTAGETVSVAVATIEETDSEPDETFTVGLSVSGTSLPVTATDTATGTITDDDTARLTVSDASVSEGDSLTFTVTLNHAPVSGGLTATPNFTDRTAQKGKDYTENTAALSFTGNVGEQHTFKVATIRDEIAEGAETFTAWVTVSGTSATVKTDPATGTITDPGPTPAVTIEDANVSEGEPLTFTVTLDNQVSGGLTVTPSFTDVTATSGADYTENTAAITFAGTAGETQTFTVATIEDTEAEPDETFTVSLMVSGTSEKVTATDTAQGQIDNDEATLTIADASEAEGEALAFRLRLNGSVPGGLTVTPSFTDGTATEGTDYTENTEALTFAGTAGEAKTLTVATTEDTDEESDETLTVGLTVSGVSGSVTVTATDTATGTILDDDGVPAVTIADASAAEGAALTFTVTLDRAVHGGLTVTPSFTDGTAVKGTDYTENTAALTFAGARGEMQTFTVATTADADGEHETFTVGLSVSGTSETVTATDTAIGTIIDGDGAAVWIVDARATEGNEITFAAVLSKAVSGGLTVTPSFTDGTATKGADYTENTAAITFTGTRNEVHVFTVATTEDADVEPDETFTVGLSVSGTSETVAAVTATGLIFDDDGAPAVTIADASASEGESMTFTVTLDKPVWGGLTVTPNFTDGTATKGTDYTENTAAMTFAGTRGETETFTVATTEDTDAENDETFTVSLSVSGTSATVTATDTATGTITDDDRTRHRVVRSLTVDDAVADEGDPLTFTVTLGEAVAGGLTVTPSFTDGTTTKGTDYTENTAALTFAGTAGETQTLTVATTEDADEEDEETFTVSLTASWLSETVTATDTATGTIIDDDGEDESTTTLALTVADASAAEGDSMTFTVTLDKAVSGGLTVTPSFADVTATEGTDYTANTAALTFAGTAGETRTFTVATIEDTDHEDDETFTVSLTVSGTAETVTVTDTATGTITDDDGEDETTLAMTVADASADEGDAMTFTVTLDEAVSGGLTVTPSFTDVTATEGTDYTANTAALTFAGTAGETRTFTLSTIEDAAEEGDETFTVSLAVSGTAEAVTATDTATGTILDDDGDGGSVGGGAAAVTIADADAGEGQTLTFTVTLDKAVSGGLTVTPSFTDVTATEGTDYTANTAALTFAGTAGETRTFTLSTIEDAAEEGDETFTVSLTLSGATAVTATDTATGRIVDDDLTPVALRAEPLRVSETAGPTTIEVTAALEGGTSLSQPTAVRVTVGAADDAAVSGTDYTASPASFTVTIPAGSAEGSSTFTLGPVNDTLLETDEDLTLSGASGSRPVTGTAVTLEDDEASSARLVVRLEPDTVSESAGPTPVTVVAEIVGATPTTPLPVTVKVGDQDDSARLTEDYEPVDAFQVLIPAGASQETVTFVLSPIPDDLIEGNETLTVTGEASRVGTASDQGVIVDEDLAEVRSEGTGRTLFLLARAIGSEALAAIEERFRSAGPGRRGQLGRLPTHGPGTAGWPAAFGGQAASFAGTGMPGAGPGMPAGAGAGPAGAPGSSAGPFAGVAAYGPGGMGMGPGMPPQQQPFDTLAWLDGANFAAPLDRGQDPGETPAGTAGGEAEWVVWGRAATTRTTVQATPGAQARGDLFTMHAGVDTRVGSRALLGVAVSHSQGKLGYTLGTLSGAAPAAVEGGLTSVQPYVQWAPRAGLELWGLGGAGRGTLQVSDTFGAVDTGIGMRLAGGGVRQEVTAAGGMAVKADLFHVALASDAQMDLPVARATATRARLLLEWESEWAASASSRIRPRLELGGRWDGGSDVGGLGTEVGGGISLAHVGLGLELTGAGRYLLAHQAAGFEEWGASVALRAGPGVADRGPWVSVEPEWGAAASRMQAFWGPQVDPGLHPGAAVGGASGAQPGRLRLAAGYALPETGADLRFEATRETYGPHTGPSQGVQTGPRLGVRISATFDW